VSTLFSCAKHAFSCGATQEQVVTADIAFDILKVAW